MGIENNKLILHYPNFIVNRVFFEKKDARVYFSSKQFLNSFILFLVKFSNNVLKQNGYVAELALIGMGFKFTDFNSKVVLLNIGYSHFTYYFLPSSVSYRILKQYIAIFGYDKNLITKAASKLKNLKVPDKYKGKGARYLNEIIIKKKGKQKQQR